MKILITGACGFVGSTLAIALKEQGHDVVGADNFIRPGSELNRKRLSQLGIAIFYADIRSADDLTQIPSIEWIIDAAANPSVLAGIDGASSSRSVFDHNLLSTVNLLELCKKYNAGFTLLSTSRVYSIPPLSELPVTVKRNTFVLDRSIPLPIGIDETGLTEDFSTTPPISLYGASKLASELIALEYGLTFNFPVWINRCGVLAGAGQFGRPDQGIFSFWINAYLRRKPLKYTGFGGSGNQVRDFLHPLDLIPLMQKQWKKDATHTCRIYNVGGGNTHAFSLAQLSDWCEKRFGHHTVGSDPKDRAFDIPWMVMSNTRVNADFGFTPQMSAQDILEEIAEHAEKKPAVVGDIRKMSEDLTHVLPAAATGAPLTKLSIVIPARDEEGCIASTVRHLHLELSLHHVPHEIVVVDDGSKDQTLSILKHVQETIPELLPVENLDAHGFGRAIIKGLESMTGDAVVIMMADESDDCRDVVRYWNELNQGFDCVFGSRFIKGGGVIDYPWLKLRINRLANYFVRLAFGHGLNDTTNAFKAYRKTVIEGCRPLLAPHFNLTVELPLKAIVRGYSYTIVPITWRNRRTGEAKLKIREMGSRYFFIVAYIWLEKYFARGDYKKDKVQPPPKPAVGQPALETST